MTTTAKAQKPRTMNTRQKALWADAICWVIVDLGDANADLFLTMWLRDIGYTTRYA